jgi:LPS export ABC transporter protein LptC
MRMTIVLATVVAVAAGACKPNKSPPVVTGAGVADSADQTFYGMRSIMTTNGVQRGELTADTAYVLDGTTRFDLRHTHVNFTTDTGAPQGTMDANRGVYSTTRQVLEGWGNVVVKLVDGRSLRSPHVIYNQVSHLITSDTNYTIQRGADTQHGIGFTSNQTFSQFQCMRACGGSTSVLLPER